MASTGDAGRAGSAWSAQDDVLVREYRQGDDLRRVHWRSTARWGELMVRREEQPWDPSASVAARLPEAAHAGRGMHSSLEWAVSAAASIAIHFLDDGFGIEIYEPTGPCTSAAASASTARPLSELVLNRLTDLKARATTSLRYAVESATIDRPGQLVIAILGRMTADDANTLLRVRRNRAQGLAMMMDVDSFADQPGTVSERAQHELAAQILRDNQWWVSRFKRGTGVAEAWSALEQLEGGLMRASDRYGLAVMISVALASFTLRPLTSDSSYLGLRWLLICLIGGFSIACAELGDRRHRGARGAVRIWRFAPSRSAVDHAGQLTPVVRALCRSVGRGHRAHADPGIADGRPTPASADLRHDDRR